MTTTNSNAYTFISRSRLLGKLVTVLVVVVNLSQTSCTGPTDADRPNVNALPVSTDGQVVLPGPDQRHIEQFIRQRGYDSWDSQDAHLSGVVYDGVTYAVHEYIQVYYSPQIGTWITGTPPKAGDIPDNAMIVAFEHEPPQEGGAPGRALRARSMVRSNAGGSHDGWFWSTTELDASGSPLPANSSGSFGEAACFGCHASADNDGMVFLDASGPLPPPDDWVPDAQLASRDAPAPQRQPRGPLAEADPDFLAYYDVPDVPTSKVVPFPAKHLDRVWAGMHAGMSGADRESFITSDQCRGCHDANQLLSNSSPDMWYPEPDPSTTLAYGADTPDAGTFRNFSAYGEWSASLNALSGRDPVWHAQVDFERNLRPTLKDFTTDTCFLCHGPMAQRQIKLDRGPDTLFTIDMFYAEDGPNAKYGALARDGVSCAVCHQIGSPDLGVDPELRKWAPNDPDVTTSGFFLPTDFKTYTAMFPNPDLDNPGNAYSHGYFGPYPDNEIQSLPMDRSIGLPARWGAGDSDELTNPQIGESKLCGSCHTVLVPALPVHYKLPDGVTSPFTDPHMKMSFEQTTYFEWRNSQYENEKKPFNPTAITCQGCHMASHGEANAKRIVNMESDRFPPVLGKATGSITFEEHTPIYRHVLLGINYFVFEMFEQFSDLLGTKDTDTGVPENTLDATLNSRDWIENHARNITADLRITDIQDSVNISGQDYLEVEVEVTNYAGHKFPTGAGFRRAFLQFEVLGANDEVLWASGRTNSLGVLVGPDGQPLPSEETIVPDESQPHHQIITAQDQVQVYETRALNSEVELQTTVLGIYYEYKDNRILPIGYTVPKERDVDSMRATASALVGDPAKQPPGVIIDPPAGTPEEATEHPTVLDNGMTPFQVVYDPDYWSDRAAGGQDFLRYRVPLSEIDGWASVRAQLYYQTIPPYYLRDRFQTGQEDRYLPNRDMNRLVHMASRLNLDGTPAEGWSLRIGAPALKIRGDTADTPLTPARKLQRLIEHYDYLDLEGPTTHR